MSARLPLALVALGLLAAGTAGASPGAPKPSVTARAYSVRVLVPGQPAAGTQAASAPPDAVALGGSYSYPADGSVVATGSMSASASTDVGVRSADANASSEVDLLQLFHGEITAETVTSRAAATATSQSGSPDVAGQAIVNLVILGQPVTPTANMRVPLADWGFAVLLEQATDTTAPAGRTAAHASAAAIDIHLTAAHGGLSAGSQILVGPVDAAVQVKAAPPPPPPPPPPTPGGGGPGPTSQHPHPKPTVRKTNPSKPPETTPSPFGSPIVHVTPPSVHPKLTAGGYVFPVYGPVSYTDTFGAPRVDVGWHHGDDIFAPLGAPVLAVANGTVFSVGWNDLGGNRLWLKDRQGNEFYYAHLSAYSPLAANGARVKAGDVLGFVGNTGDAITTPYHLHFEIHPVSLLYKGYDGVVDPTAYLNAWRRLRDLSFSGGVTPASAIYAAHAKTAPTAPLPGAYLLKAADISSASGLDRNSIKRALAAEQDVAANEGAGAIVGAPSPVGSPKG